MVDRSPPPTDLDAAQLGGGGKLTRKPERAHDERRVDALVRQPQMTHDIERMREYAPHADAAHDGARLERKDGSEPKHHTDAHKGPLGQPPTVERAHDRRGRQREQRAARRERRDHMKDAHEQRPIETGEREEAQPAHDGEAHAHLERETRPSIRREVRRGEQLQKRRFQETGHKHRDDAHKKKRQQVRARVEPEHPGFHVALFHG